LALSKSVPFYFFCLWLKYQSRCESACRGRQWGSLSVLSVNCTYGEPWDGGSHIWLESIGGRETAQGQRQRFRAGAQLSNSSVTRIAKMELAFLEKEVAYIFV